MLFYHQYNDNTDNSLNPPLNLTLLFNQWNDVTAESDKKNSENFITVKILILTKFRWWKLNQIHFLYFHINSCSLNEHFEDLDNLLKATNKTFDVIVISE